MRWFVPLNWRDVERACTTVGLQRRNLMLGWCMQHACSELQHCPGQASCGCMQGRVRLRHPAGVLQVPCKARHTPSDSMLYGIVLQDLSERRLQTIMPAHGPKPALSLAPLSGILCSDMLRSIMHDALFTKGHPDLTQEDHMHACTYWAQNSGVHWPEDQSELCSQVHQPTPLSVLL